MVAWLRGRSRHWGTHRPMRISSQPLVWNEAFSRPQGRSNTGLPALRTFILPRVKSITVATVDFIHGCGILRMPTSHSGRIYELALLRSVLPTAPISDQRPASGRLVEGSGTPAGYARLLNDWRRRPATYQAQAHNHRLLSPLWIRWAFRSSGPPSRLSPRCFTFQSQHAGRVVRPRGAGGG